MAGPDFDSEIKQLQATMSTIGKVLDLPAVESEIADLAEQVAAPDLWDDQSNAASPRSRARSTASRRCRTASTTSS